MYLVSSHGSYPGPRAQLLDAGGRWKQERLLQETGPVDLPLLPSPVSYTHTQRVMCVCARCVCVCVYLGRWKQGRLVLGRGDAEQAAAPAVVLT